MNGRVAVRHGEALVEAAREAAAGVVVEPQVVPRGPTGLDDPAQVVVEANGTAQTYTYLTELHHSSFLAGEPVAGAGLMRVHQGRITMINDSSGNYRPSREFFQQVIDQLRKLGADTPQ